MRINKKAAAVAVAAVTLAGSGVAFAFFSGGGGLGTGTATTTATASRAITPSASAGPISYDGSTSAVTVTLDNANKYSVQVASVVVAIDTGNASWPAGCPTTSFSLGGTIAAGPYLVPAAGASHGQKTISGVTIAFVDDPNTLQNACVGYTVPLTVTAS